MKNQIIVLTCLALSAIAANAQNLIVNGDFSAQNSGFTNTYSFIPTGTSTANGSYGIRTLSTDFNPGYVAFNDHTSGSGYMMLIDGSQSPTVCWQESVAVQTNQSYFFSAWLASSDGSNPGVVRFAINGAQIGSDVSLPTTSGIWQNSLTSWNSGTNTTATITIVDENTQSLGNDFALDDISFGASGDGNPVVASIFPAVEIDFNSQPNFHYQVQYSTAADTNTWNNLGNPLVGTGFTLSTFDGTRGHSQRFYRIVTLP